MVIAHFMVGAQKKMVLGPAGWLRNARNEEVVAILFVIGSVCVCPSFFRKALVVVGGKKMRIKREERFPSVCDLFWCALRAKRARALNQRIARRKNNASRENTQKRARGSIKSLSRIINIYIYIHAYRCFNNERLKGPLHSVESAFPRRSGFLLF